MRAPFFLNLKYIHRDDAKLFLYLIGNKPVSDSLNLNVHYILAFKSILTSFETINRPEQFSESRKKKLIGVNQRANYPD